MKLNLSIQSSEGCAWRALYFSRVTKCIDHVTGKDYGPSRHQFFHIGVDPVADRGPQFFGGFCNPWNRRGLSFSWRFRLPRMRWRQNMGPIASRVYMAQQRFWYSLDGRNKTKAARA